MFILITLGIHKNNNNINNVNQNKNGEKIIKRTCYQRHRWKMGNDNKNNYSFELKLKHYNIKRAKN